MFRSMWTGGDIEILKKYKNFQYGFTVGVGI